MLRDNVVIVLGLIGLHGLIFVLFSPSVEKYIDISYKFQINKYASCSCLIQKNKLNLKKIN